MARILGASLRLTWSIGWARSVGVATSVSGTACACFVGTSSGASLTGVALHAAKRTAETVKRAVGNFVILLSIVSVPLRQRAHLCFLPARPAGKAAHLHPNPLTPSKASHSRAHGPFTTVNRQFWQN
jgi:hypothetical protein